MITRQLSTLLKHELRLRRLDRAGLLIAVLAPVGLIALTSAAFGDLDQPDRVTIAVADAGDGSVAELLASRFSDDPSLRQVATVAVYGSHDQARAAVADGRQEAGLLLPAELTVGSRTLSQSSRQVVVLESAEKPIASAVAGYVAQQVSARVSTAALTGRLLEQGAGAAAVPATLRNAQPLSLVDLPVSADRLRAASYFGPSMATLLLFFSVGFAGRSLWQEQATGTARRQRVIGVPQGAAVAAKLVVGLVYGAATMTAAWLACVVGFRAGWGPAPGVLLLIVAVTLAAVALSFALATLARSESQLESMAACVIFTFAILGGSFIPPAATPDGLRSLAALTPTGQVQQGFVDLVTTGDAAAAVQPASWLLLFALGCLLLGAARVGRLGATS